jgi:hypothetical protein
MNDEKDKKPAPIQPVSTKPIPRSPLTEMRHREIAHDHAIKIKPKLEKTPEAKPDRKKRDD